MNLVKKIISLFMLILIIFSLSSCNNKTNEKNPNIEYPIFIFYNASGLNDFAACFIDEKNNMCIASVNIKNDHYIYEKSEIIEYGEIKTISDFKNVFKGYDFEEGFIIPEYTKVIYENLQAISNDTYVIYTTDILNFKYGNSKWHSYHMNCNLLNSPNMHYSKEFIDDTVDTDRIEKELRCTEIFDILNYVSDNHIDSIYTRYNYKE